jgi:hypothetical protein
MIFHHQRLAGEPAEINDDFGTLGRSQHQTSH